LPDRMRKSLQCLSGLSLGLLDSTFSIHALLESLEIVSEMRRLRRGILGSCGFKSCFWSRSLVSSIATLDKPGLKLCENPQGYDA
jgi:hypothetical protein